VIFAGGMTVVPWFIGCHCHPRGVPERFDANADVRTVRSDSSRWPPSATM
jgi:hypothetical protein